MYPANFGVEGRKTVKAEDMSVVRQVRVFCRVLCVAACCSVLLGVAENGCRNDDMSV